jgi:hypothetical protein
MLYSVGISVDQDLSWFTRLNFYPIGLNYSQDTLLYEKVGNFLLNQKMHKM